MATPRERLSSRLYIVELHLEVAVGMAQAVEDDKEDYVLRNVLAALEAVRNVLAEVRG